MSRVRVRKALRHTVKQVEEASVPRGAEAVPGGGTPGLCRARVKRLQ